MPELSEYTVLGDLDAIGFPDDLRELPNGPRITANSTG